METKALLDQAAQNLRAPQDGIEMASAASYSRFHFHRMFRKALGETPGSFRRRIRMERAAWQLTSGELCVTEIAFDAGYSSLEAFTRAFQRAFGVSPSLYRRIAPSSYKLKAPNGLHYRPEGIPLLGDTNMDLLDRLLTHDEDLTRILLEKAGELPNEALDRPLGDFQVLCYEAPQRTVRDLFHSLLMDKEVWLSVLKGSPFPDKAYRSLPGLKARAERMYPAFRGLAREVRDEGKWDETFVDELCSPPATFPYGGMLSFVLFCGAHRLQLLLSLMRPLGVDVDFGVAYGRLMATPQTAGKA